MNENELKDLILRQLLLKAPNMLLGDILNEYGIQNDIVKFTPIIDYLVYREFIYKQHKPQDIQIILTDKGRTFCNISSFSNPNKAIINL